MIENRTGKKTIGFGADISGNNKTDDELLKEVEPQDFVKYGIIPELVGRLPVIVTLNSLDEEAMINILTKPKNAVLKQYKALFAMDNVELCVEEDALSSIAHQAIERKTGARGLRAILEKVMLNLMYEIPSEEGIKKCTITKETVLEGADPLIEKEVTDED